MEKIDVYRVTTAANLELALASYFTDPTCEQVDALRVINRSLQEDQENFRKAIEKGILFGGER